MATLQGKTLFITGASRGIGKAIALRAARDGANVTIAAKTDRPHPKLPGTIHTVAAEVEAAGGRALAVATDIRRDDQVEAAVARTVERFGGIDILVNNASAIWLEPVERTPMRRFDLIWSVNARGTYLCSRTCLPHLKAGTNPHILTLSPPPTLDAQWFQDHAAYTLSKYGMSLLTIGLAEELRDAGIAANSLWPRTVIKTAALLVLGDRFPIEKTRNPEIVADAAHAILCRDSRSCTGNFFIDEEVLREEGVTDFSGYAVEPGQPLLRDLFLEGPAEL
jgi:citronellol/citronellal dehydrogenase